MRLFLTILSFFFATSLLVSCDASTLQKTPGGMPYLLFRGNGTQVAKPGQYLKVHASQQFDDSLAFSTFGKTPLYIMVGEQSQPYDIPELFPLLHSGDSVVATQMLDTIMKNSPQGSYPPGFKKGQRLITKLKVLGVFTDEATKKADEDKEKNIYLRRELNEIEKFLGDKAKGLVRTKSGAFLEMQIPGEGDLIKTGDTVSVLYTGKTLLKGKVFDSNMDRAFGPTKSALKFTVGAGEMIPGFDEAMLLMRKGGQAKVYLPSTLAYGANPPPGAPIQPYEHLIFEFKVEEVARFIEQKMPVKDTLPPVSANQQ